jgi:G-rich domain on putative tyrosine kinase
MRAQMEATDLAMKSKRNDQQRIQAQISTYQRRLELSPTIQEEHKKLTRDYQSALQFYNELLGKKNQSEMATDLERRQQGEQFRVMDPPNLPERPAFPDRRLFAAGGLGVGFVIGLTLVAFFEWHDRSVRNERDVELWLKLPTLGVIPDFSDSDDADKKKTKDAKQKKDAKSKKDKARKVAPKPKIAAVRAPGSTATPASALSPGVETHV